jgi:hypothetical protein
MSGSAIGLPSLALLAKAAERGGLSLEVGGLRGRQKIPAI